MTWKRHVKAGKAYIASREELNEMHRPARESAANRKRSPKAKKT